MNWDEDLDTLLALDAVISNNFGRSNFGQSRQPHAWAKVLLDSAINGPLHFGLTEDLVKVEDLIRTLRRADELIAGLSPGTREIIVNHSKIWQMVARPNGPNLLVSSHSEIRRLLDVLEDVSGRRLPKRLAGLARNWRAAAVAGSCRIVWAAAKWESDGKTTPPLPVPQSLFWKVSQDFPVNDAWLEAEYSKFIALAAPTTEKHDAPGPFGRFIEDVFRVLGILGKNGEPFPAASALRAWRSASKQKI